MYNNNSIFNCALLLVPHKKSNVYGSFSNSRQCPSYFTLLCNLSSGPSYSCSKFKFKRLPPYCDDFCLSGNEAVNFVTLKDKVEMALGRFAGDKVKIRLVFAVFDLVPIDTLEARMDQGIPITFTECLSYIKKAIYLLFIRIPYHEEGIEFIFGSKAVDLLLNMINDALKSQGKDPEMIQIWMTFWLSEDDDGYNDDDEDDDDNGDGYELSKLPTNICFRPSAKYSNSFGVISRRSYSTKCSGGGHGNINSIDICFYGGNAVNHNFVFKELSGVLSSEQRYHCHIHIMSRINKIPLCKELEIMCAQLGYSS